MKLQKDELLEKIRKLNKEKPLKEGTEIQRVLPPADADAVEQHEEALEANKKRLDPKNYEKDVKDLIKETASEESRYSHFDVVDRKDLAKKINEAKEKKIPFKVARSTKEGFRYDFSLLKEEFVKKDAGDPEINKNAFNKATDIGKPAEAPLTEDYNNEIVLLNATRDAYSAEDCLAHTLTVGELTDYLLGEFGEKQPIVISFDRGYTYGCINGGSFSSIEKETYLEENKTSGKIDALRKTMLGECEKPAELNEELKVYTSTLDNFHPSKEAEALWEEIKDSKKIEDLEYALESLYPDGISDEALDDMLIHEEEWVRDLIGLPIEDGEEAEEESIDEFDAKDESEPVESDDEIEDDVEPVDYEESDDEINPEGEEMDEIDPDEEKVVEITDNDLEESEPEKEKELKEAAQKEKSEEITPVKEGETNQPKEDELSKLAEGFVNSQFKATDRSAAEDTKDDIKEAAESCEDDDEIVAVNDSEIADMLNMPKEEKK